MDGSMFLPEFDQEMANTRKALERVPDDRLEFKPHEKSYSLRELATHIANLPNWTDTTFATSELDLGQGWTPPRASNRAEILALFDAAVKGARAALEKATADDFRDTWTLKTGDEVHFTLPKGLVFRSFVLRHIVHHRAQLTVYLRLLDVPVPGMYGPSADEM